MSDKIELSEEELDKRLSHNYCAGRHSELERVTTFLKTRAGDLYAAGKDAEASLVRELMRSIEERLKKASDELQQHIKEAMEKK